MKIETCWLIGAHYLGDVLAGIAVGLIAGRLA